MAIKVSKGREAAYAAYKSSKRQESNRRKKLERQLKLQPNNTKVAEALKDVHYRRHTPKTPTWKASTIAEAQILKYFTGKFDKDAFNVDPKLSHAGRAARNQNIFDEIKNIEKKTQNKQTKPVSFFSIAARI